MLLLTTIFRNIISCESSYADHLNHISKLCRFLLILRLAHARRDKSALAAYALSGHILRLAEYAPDVLLVCGRTHKITPYSRSLQAPAS